MLILHYTIVRSVVVFVCFLFICLFIICLLNFCVCLFDRLFACFGLIGDGGVAGVFI